MLVQLCEVLIESIDRVLSVLRQVAVDFQDRSHPKPHNRHGNDRHSTESRTSSHMSHEHHLNRISMDSMELQQSPQFHQRVLPFLTLCSHRQILIFLVCNLIWVKKVWFFLEKKIIPKLQTVITVSDSIKKHYQNLYGISAIVIRNIPEIKTISQKNFEIDTKGKKVILYQGSVNIGRGIELMIDTMALLDEYLFIVIGDGDILEQLKEKVSNLSLHDKVKFIGKKTPEELKELTPNATIGMSLEEDLGLNYRYALPNKIFDYLHANVPVIVADLPEMRSLIKKHLIGEILSERTHKILAKTIINMTSISYEKELKTAKKELNWSKEKEKLISIFSKLDK